jgi:hypothetical protein
MLAVIESHIRTLEFAFCRVYPTIDFQLKQQIEVELGHAYHSKMLIIKNYCYDNNCQHTQNYPSKLYQESSARTDEYPNATDTANLEVPQLWEYHI